MKRVDYDDVEFDDQLAIVDGLPFTGVVYGLDPDGRLQSESRYRDGLPEGLAEEWYPDGRIERRWIAVRGRGSAEMWEWHPNGRLRSYRRNVDQFPVEVKTWDEDGMLLTDERREPPVPLGGTPS